MLTKTDERYKLLEQTIKKLGYDKSALIEILHSAQNIFGYLEIKTLKLIAIRLKLPYSKVFGVVTFYHFFKLKPNGKHHVDVCRGTSCHIQGSQKILESIEKKYHVMPGGTSKDGLFSLSIARCLGSCSLSPIVVVDDHLIGNFSLEKSCETLEKAIK